MFTKKTDIHILQQDNTCFNNTFHFEFMLESLRPSYLFVVQLVTNGLVITINYMTVQIGSNCNIVAVNH